LDLTFQAAGTNPSDTPRGVQPRLRTAEFAGCYDCRLIIDEECYDFHGRLVFSIDGHFTFVVACSRRWARANDFAKDGFAIVIGRGGSLNGAYCPPRG